MSFSGRVAHHNIKSLLKGATSLAAFTGRSLGGIRHYDSISEIERAYPNSVIFPKHTEKILNNNVDQGLIECPPESLTLKLMRSRCPFLDKKGTTIGDTHLLVYVPKTMGSEFYRSDLLASKHPSLFSHSNHYPNAAIEEVKLKERGWKLLPKLELADTRSRHGLGLREQEKILAKFNERHQFEYEVVPEVSLVFAIVAAKLIHNEQLFEHRAVRTATSTLGQPERLVVGGMSISGVTVLPGSNNATMYSWGLGLSMKL